MNDLRQALTEIGDSTPAYDVVDSAITRADRRQRTRQWTGVSAAFVAVVTVAAGSYALADRDPPAAPVAAPAASASVGASPSAKAQAGPLRCEVSYLPLPAGYPKKSLITGGDPTGRYQVGRIYPAGGPKAVIWDGRRPTVVDLPGSDDTLSDVNSAGLAVGSSFQGDKAVAWAYEGGKITQLAGEGSAADAVNERGEIAGTVQDQPVVWRSVTAQPKRLAMPSGSLMGQARGIDEDGTVIGTAIAVGGKSRAYAWSPDGTARLLDLPPTTPSGVPNGSFAFSVRNGWISGEAIVEVSEGAEYHYSTVWNLATGDVKLTPDVGRVAAVNAQGWLVGRGTDRLVLVTDTVVVGLPLPDGAKIGRYDEVDTVSDDGRIGAGELNPQNDLTGARALIWTCS